jgi:hypothetical protein
VGIASTDHYVNISKLFGGSSSLGHKTQHSSRPSGGDLTCFSSSSDRRASNRFAVSSRSAPQAARSLQSKFGGEAR